MDLERIFLSSFDRGGYLMWVIFGVSLVAWYIGVGKYFNLRRFRSQRRRFLREVETALRGEDARKSTGNESYDILLKQVKAIRNGRFTGCKGIMREFLVSSVPQLNRGFSSMSAWISIAPLLGLLGTVTGMIQTFKVITDFGVGNPSLTAEGISVALLTTQAGLTVAFPAMIFHNYLANRKNEIVNLLFKDCEQIVTRVSKPHAKATNDV
ncbi:MAG: MotA/TolQ/ExbB proton channel family protein [Chitinispirillaceae bacterium]